jgi:hypothetical protein
MKKIILSCLVLLLFFSAGSFILAKSDNSSPSKFSDFENFVKNDIGIDVKVYEKNEINPKSEKTVIKSLLKEKLAKYNIKDGVVLSIKKDEIPNNMQVLSFNNEDDAAKYIANDTQGNQPVNQAGAEGLKALAVTSYTRNYSVYVEGFLTRWIDINTRGTYSTNNYGYSVFSSVQKPWFTYNGVTFGAEVVTNSTWKSLLNGGLSAQIGGSYTKKYYLMINGLIQLYSVTKTTTKTITPTGS